MAFKVLAFSVQIVMSSPVQILKLRAPCNHLSADSLFCPGLWWNYTMILMPVIISWCWYDSARIMMMLFQESTRLTHQNQKRSSWFTTSFVSANTAMMPWSQHWQGYHYTSVIVSAMTTSCIMYMTSIGDTLQKAISYIWCRFLILLVESCSKLEFSVTEHLVEVVDKLSTTAVAFFRSGRMLKCKYLSGL